MWVVLSVSMLNRESLCSLDASPGRGFSETATTLWILSPKFGSSGTLRGVVPICRYRPIGYTFKRSEC